MATAAMITEFRDYFPEFSDLTTYPDPLVSNMIDEALFFVSSCVWGVRYSLGWLYLSAHFVYIRNQTLLGATTPITGSLTDLKVGEVDVGLSGAGDFYNDSDDALLMQTQYGARYVQMRNALVVHLYIAGTC